MNQNKVKVQGTFYIGIAQTFYSLNAITEKKLDKYLLNVEPNGWYPITNLLKIFDALKTTVNYELLFYQAGAQFIQSWYDHEGHALNLGSIGHIKLQDESKGIKMVFKDYDPKLIYSNVLNIDEKRGTAVIEICDILPKEFTYGVFNNGVFMWGDLLWMDMETEVIEETEGYTKSKVTYHFKKQNEVYDRNYLDAYIDALALEEENQMSLKLGNQLAWYIKGLKNSLEREKEISYEANKVLGQALQSQVAVSKALKKANETIRNQSLTDFLTGLNNKRYFDIEFQRLWNRALRRNESVCVMMLDIDYFKFYNDHYGHIQGDEALRQIGKCIQETARRADDIIARFGGEEFVVAAANIDEDDIHVWVKKIQERVRNEKILHEKSPISEYVTLSIGTSLCEPVKGMDPERWISKADTSLYDAKAKGRNRHSHCNCAPEDM